MLQAKYPIQLRMLTLMSRGPGSSARKRRKRSKARKRAAWNDFLDVPAAVRFLTLSLVFHYLCV
jgi:hypothetical protein